MTRPALSLRTLLAGVGVVSDAVPASLTATSVTVDSRRAGAGVVFVAAPGATPTSRDGHDFIDAAVQHGAPAVIAQRDVPGCPVPVVVVEDARRVAALLAEALAGSPSREVAVVGVTGTNGKTSVTSMVAQLCSHAGKRGAVIGTLGIGDPFAPRSTGFTTPEAEALSAAVATLRDEGAAVVGVEVSSHALATRRADGLHYTAVAFTNLTQDHLDFHGDFDAYFEAKARLFASLADEDTVAVLPAVDDPHGPALQAGSVAATLRARSRGRVWTWGVEVTSDHQGDRGDQGGGVDVHATDVRANLDGLHFSLTLSAAVTGGAPTTVTVHAPALMGRFNVDNAVVAAALALACGLPPESLATGFRLVGPPPGRMQRVPHDNTAHGEASQLQPTVLIDYAHTPDALERALLAARQLTDGRLLVVVGCGGDRDRTKRPLMARIAVDVADQAFFTDDNPRSERSADILSMMTGRLTIATERWRCIPDRRRAIGAAIRAAEPGDVVVIAGKGHEKEQLVGDMRLPFDDVTEAAAALAHRTRPAFLPRAILDEVLGAPTGAPRFTTALGVSTDSRALEAGALFVALRGERFDGHDFIEAALQRGAAAALVDKNFVARRPLPLYVVDDTLVALQALARRWLLNHQATRICLTGSNGKTTTKELIAAALRGAVDDDEVLATEGNLNNHIGVPLTALRLEPHHRFAILEMGMNHLGEIKQYCSFAPPQVGLVTNMGTAHAGNVGGVEGVAQAKAELFEALPKDGVAVVNADDPRCVREAQNKAHCRHLLFGRAPFADVRLTEAVDLEDGGQRLTITVAGTAHEVSIPLEGRHNALNACGAVATAIAAGVDAGKAVAGLATVRPAHGRLERRRRADGLLILDDSYNANPDSMEAGLTTLKETSRGRPTVAVLGDMLELGTQARAAHRHIGAAAALAGVRRLYCCGAYAADYAEGAHTQGLKDVVVAEDSGLLAASVVDGVAADDVVLIKGSRGARMERVVQALLLGPAASAGAKGPG